MKILVTGCRGLVGEGICRTLLEEGHRIIGTSRKALLAKHPRLTLIQADLRKKSDIAAFLDEHGDMEAIVHNAAIIPGERRTFTLNEGEEIMDVNFRSTYYLLKMMPNSVKNFILISGTNLAQTSSDLTDENIPFLNRNEYVTSKLAAELVCHQFALNGGMNICMLRISAPYGYRIDSEAVIPAFIRKVRENRDITLWGTGARKQTFTFVEDIGRAASFALKKQAGGVFNITGGAQVSMKELARAVKKAFPESTARIVFEDKDDPNENICVKYDIQKAEDMLGYKPVFDIDRGLGAIAAYLKSGNDARLFEEAAWIKS